MKLTIQPTQKLSGKIYLPASKSYSIRAYIVAACGGRSILTRPSDCDDAIVARKVAQQLGAKIVKRPNNVWEVRAKATDVNLGNINVQESGTVLRFILPLVALHDKQARIVGKGTLKGRPNEHLVKTLKKMGVKIKGVNANHSIPISIEGGQLKSGKIVIDGSLSSQFISALIIATAQLETNSSIHLTGRKLVSTDYITMTQQILKRTGVNITRRDSRQYNIRGGQKFKGLGSFTVPSDYGLAAFTLAAAALVDSDVTLLGNLSKDYIQADGHIIPLLRKMGVKFNLTERSIKIKGPFSLKGGIFSLKDCPDLVPIMAVLALFADRETQLVDIAHARAKESDRISDLRDELLKVGADISETKDRLIIRPLEKYLPGKTLNPHKDHRLAMAFSVLGLKIGTKVANIECSHKSYPGFVKDLKKLKAKISA